MFIQLICLEFLIEIKQRTLIKGEELVDLTQSIELFHQSLQKFMEYLTECERYLNTQKPVQRHFRLYQTLLKQIDEHKSFENQCEVYKEHLINLDKLAAHLTFVVPKKDSIHIRNSLTSVQRRWEKVLMRTNQRSKELEKMKKVISNFISFVLSVLNRLSHRRSLISIKLEVKLTDKHLCVNARRNTMFNKSLKDDIE